MKKWIIEANCDNPVFGLWVLRKGNIVDTPGFIWEGDAYDKEKFCKMMCTRYKKKYPEVNFSPILVNVVRARGLVNCKRNLTVELIHRLTSC